MDERTQHLEAIARLAKECREAQRASFASRLPRDLRAAKESEQALDDALVALDGIHGQIPLFHAAGDQHV